MNPRVVLLSGCLAALTSCNGRATAPPAAAPFEEHSEPGKALRAWVTDPLPEGTVLVGYRQEEAWDGTVMEEWILDCPSGFALLRQASVGREALQVPADAPYQVLDNRLAPLGVRLKGDRPDRVWSLHWQTGVPRTSVSGNLYPHATGEMLRIERVSLK